MAKKIKSEVKYTGVRFNVIEDTYIEDNGKQYERDIVDTKDAAFILPITQDNEVIFIKQIREVINRETLEIPAGIIEDGENPRDAAIRELEEETGYIAGNMEHLITVYSSCGYSNEKMHIFVATDLKQGHQTLDIDEHITQIVKMPLEECFELAKKEYFIHAGQNVALLMYKLKNEK